MVWVKIFKIPIGYWSPKRVSAIVSFESSVCRRDEVCIADFARVCVDIRAGKELPNQIEVVGEWYAILVV